ncbi:MAG: GtrA family protein [Chloroflexota bacterium]|nr:GtrA family protein [Chloroflexota bacterium]
MSTRITSRPRPQVDGELGRMLRFGAVGLLGVAINSALLWLLTERAEMYYLVSSIIATEVAILCNFALNHAWTFASPEDGQSVPMRLIKFNLVSFGGLGLTVTTLFALKQFAGIHYLVANLVAVGSGAVWNYVANRRWTWRVRSVVRE